MDAFPLLVITEEKDWAIFTVAVAGVTVPAVRSTYGEEVTVTSRQEPLQLLPSFDSETVPDIDVLLSAQKRTDRVPAAPVKMYVYEAVALPPPASGGIGEGVVLNKEIVPVPPAPVAT